MDSKKVLLLVVLCHLCCTNEFTERNTREKRKVVMPSLGSALNVGRFVISTSLDIFSLIKGNEYRSEMTAKLDSIEDILNEIKDEVSLNNAQLTTILNRLLKLPYTMSIVENEREIKHCFDTFKTFVKSRSSQQSIDNMKDCYSSMKNVKEIARILSGETLGKSTESLFDISIREHGHCNGTEINGLLAYLKQLLFQGCFSVVVAEALKYNNSSYQYYTYCMTAFQESDAYKDNLFKRCSKEKCNVVLNSMELTLQDAETLVKAYLALSNQFPWFHFTVIEIVECRQECLQENFKSLTRPLPFNLHTFHGKGKMFLVLYRTNRYTIDELVIEIEFEIPKNCFRDFIDDLDIEVYDKIWLESTSLYMYKNPFVKLSENICEGRKTKCNENAGSVNSQNTITLMLALSVFIPILDFYT